MILRRWLWAYATVIMAWLILPTLVIVPIAFSPEASFNFPPKGFSLQWFENAFTDPLWLKAMGNSIAVALLTTLVATSLGTAAAFGLRAYRWKGKALVENMLMTPLIVPAVVLAIGVYSLFMRFGLLGSLVGFVAAHTVLALPLVIVNVAASLQGYDRNLSLASASLGAGPAQTFMRVTLPLIAPGVGAGALFAFVTSFDEVVISLFIQSPTLQTLPVKIFRSVTQNTDPTVAAVAVLMLIVTTTLILLLQFGGRKKTS